MLEKAIIDATALKEAAVKNAENLILEKYSNQIKEAVGSLLEQEDPAMAEGEGPPAPGGEGPPGDPSGDVEESAVMEHIPLAVTSEDLDEEVEIPLEELMSEIIQLSETVRFNGDFVGDPEIQENSLLEVLDEDIEEMLVGKDDDDGSGPTCGENLGYMEEDAIYEGGDTVDLEEGDLEEALEEAVREALSEELVVDIAPRKSGWAGTPSTMIELAEEEILALEQDSERREYRSAVQKAVNKLGGVNENLTRQNTQYRAALEESKKQVAKFGRIVLLLKEKLDEGNLTNARLLYQNKALNSDSLNERQKRKLVEAVSNADTVEEAKVIFETLESTVGSTSRKKQPESLREVVEKSSSMILSNRKREPARQKDNPTYDRWKSLAGLKSQQD